jgi:membrane protein required for colicin V production
VVASFRKGLSREIIGFASVVLALLLSCWFYGTVAGYLSDYLSSRAVANSAGFLIVFCTVMLAGAVASRIAGGFLKVTGLSLFDHLLGAAFELMRGVLIAAAMVLAVMAFSKGDQPPRAVMNSRLAPYAASTARVFVAVAPRELKDGFHKTYGQVSGAWKREPEKSTHDIPRTDKGKK